jgi:hypothetical protein
MNFALPAEVSASWRDSITAPVHNPPAKGKKSIFVCTFCTESDHFAKTGSGQTYENSRKKRSFVKPAT